MPQSKQNTKGYRQKPLWIKTLSLLLLLAPIGNLILTFSSLKLPVTNWQSWSHWLQFVSVEVWALNILLFLSGLALLKVRTWTHLFASTCLVGILVYNITRFKNLEFLGPFVLGISILGSLLIFALLYTKQFREPYFKPRLRWWETSPRYKARLQATLKSMADATSLDGDVLDISRSGLLVTLKTDNNLQIGDEHLVSLPSKLELSAQVVRKKDHAYGLKFTSLSWSEKRHLKNFIEQLANNPESLLR